MRRQTGSSLYVLVILAAIVISFVPAAGCTATAPAHLPTALTPASEDPGTGVLWEDLPLSDLFGRGNFSIGMLADKPVLVPVDSVSCPSCIVQLRSQLDEIARLDRHHPGRIAVVSLDLDTDPGPGFMAAYGDPENFTGWSARSPPDLTLALLHRFGPFAIDTGTVPVILACPDRHDLLLPTGVKTAESLNETIAREC